MANPKKAKAEARYLRDGTVWVKLSTGDSVLLGSAGCPRTAYDRIDDSGLSRTGAWKLDGSVRTCPVTIPDDWALLSRVSSGRC